MATIPDPTAMPRRISTAQAPIARVGNAGAVGNAVQGLGGTIQREVEEQQDRKSRFEYNSAKASFITSKIKLDNSFRDDPEYDTINDRYSAGVEEILNEQAARISNPRMRDEFLMEQQINVARGTEQISNLARSKEVDAMQGQVIEQLSSLSDVVVGGEMGLDAVASARGLVESAVENGYLTHVQGVNMINKWKEDSATAWLDSIAPEKRLDALNTPMAENLPADKLAGLRRAAEAELIDYKAKEMVGEWGELGTSREDRIEQMKKINDPKLYDEVQRRSDNQINQATKAETERQKEIFDELYYPISNGDISIDDVSEEQFKSLDPAIQANLRNAEANAARTLPIRSNRNVLNMLQDLESRGDYDGMSLVLRERGAELSDSDYKQFSQAGVDGVAPIEYTSLKAAKGMLTNMMTSVKGAKPDEVAYSRLHGSLAEWHQQYWLKSGQTKLPSDDEIERQVDRLLMDTTVPDIGFFGADIDKPLYELSPDEIKTVVDHMRETNKPLFDEVLSNVGTDADPLTFIEAYENAARQ